MSEVVDLAYKAYCDASEAEDEGYLDEAIRLYESSARMGLAAAQINLGNLFDRRGNSLKAIYWYVRAYRSGDPLGAWNLAMHYVPRANRRWFRLWIGKAAAMGDEDAVGELAKLGADANYITVLPFMEQDNDPYRE